MIIFDCRDSWATPIVREITFDWRDFVPLAKAEASKFYRKQERGRFRVEDLLSTALVALATSKGVNHAIKAINGALLDFARDDHKLVGNVEMSEAEYIRTCTTSDDLPAKRSAKVEPNTYLDTCLGKEVRVTVYPPGPYLSNARLLAGAGNFKPLVSSRHNKVSVALGRATNKDDWNQVIGGQVRAKVDRDANNEQNFDPRPSNDGSKSHEPPMSWSSRGAITDRAYYTGAGRKRRFSKSYFNANEDRRPDFPEIANIPMMEARYRSPDRDERWRQFSFEELSSRRGSGNATSSYKSVAPNVIRRTMTPPTMTLEEAAKRSGRRTAPRVSVDMTKFGRSRFKEPLRGPETRRPEGRDNRLAP